MGSKWVEAFECITVDAVSGCNHVQDMCNNTQSSACKYTSATHVAAAACGLMKGILRNIDNRNSVEAQMAYDLAHCFQ